MMPRLHVLLLFVSASLLGCGEERMSPRLNCQRSSKSAVNLSRQFDLHDQLGKEAELTFFHHLFHGVHAVEIVDGDRFEGEVTAVGVVRHFVQYLAEVGGLLGAGKAIGHVQVYPTAAMGQEPIAPACQGRSVSQWTDAVAYSTLEGIGIFGNFCLSTIA